MPYPSRCLNRKWWVRLGFFLWEGRHEFVLHRVERFVGGRNGLQDPKRWTNGAWSTVAASRGVYPKTNNSTLAATPTAPDHIAIESVQYLRFQIAARTYACMIFASINVSVDDRMTSIE